MNKSRKCRNCDDFVILAYFNNRWMVVDAAPEVLDKGFELSRSSADLIYLREPRYFQQALYKIHKCSKPKAAS